MASTMFQTRMRKTLDRGSIPRTSTISKGDNMFNDYDYMMGLTDYTPLAWLASLGLFWLIGAIVYRDK